MVLPQPKRPKGAPPAPASGGGRKADCHSPRLASAAVGGGTRRGQAHVTRQQLRQAQHRQRAVDQQRIKELEQQLGALREQLQVSVPCCPK